MARPVRSPAPRRALAVVVAVLALGVPTVAYPISLAQLLQLPLEQLLHLKITSMRGGAAALAGAPHER
jgi:hypothetical protein